MASAKVCLVLDWGDNGVQPRWTNFASEPDFVEQLQHDFQRFYGHMFKHFVADVVWSGCSFLRVFDNGEKFIDGKGLI